MRYLFITEQQMLTTDTHFLHLLKTTNILNYLQVLWKSCRPLNSKSENWHKCDFLGFLHSSLSGHFTQKYQSETVKKMKPILCVRKRFSFKTGFIYSSISCRRHLWDRICTGLCCRRREVAYLKSLAEILQSRRGNGHQLPPPPVQKEQMRNFTSWTPGPLTCVILDNPLQCQAMDHLTCCCKTDFLPYVLGKGHFPCLRENSCPASPMEEKIIPRQNPQTNKQTNS